MKFDEILNENVEMLNEGALTNFLTATFKGFKRTVGSAAEASLTKALNDVAQGGKKVALSALRKNSSYQDALKTTVAEASRAQYLKTFDQLLQFDKKAAQKLVNDVQTGMEKELAERAALSKTIIDKDVKSAKSAVGKTQKAVNAGRATQQDLVMATKELIANTKLQTKYADMQRVIAGMGKLNVQQISNLLKKNTKVVTGTGNSVSGGVQGTTTIATKGKFFQISKKQLSEFPGKVRRVIVTNPIKSLLAGAGLSVVALYYFFSSDDVDGIILTDENGNQVTDDVKTDWPLCITKGIEDGRFTKDDDSNELIEKNTGFIYTIDQKVINPKTRKTGTWQCGIKK
jgi:hypothetical protein